ncbi:unnamed protein product [Hydatigera taeniaeformis]|uniref:G_PROTEIN_RECEP_F3_4 domain-containing protein n=1 Tax=Hydatigena taeniaeformis TaxID=6205 RepID=A0A158RE75_HYDTA|nr:unnamed protein product [Hydatigera taeniaeformis]
MEKSSDKQVFRLYLEKRVARLKYPPDPAVFVHPEKSVNWEPFVFLGTEDEKTLRTFKTQIAKFFSMYLGSSQVESEHLAVEIMKVITSKDSIRNEVVNILKQSMSLELASYKTLDHLRLLADGGKEADGGVFAKLNRTRREAPQASKFAVMDGIPGNGADSDEMRGQDGNQKVFAVSNASKSNQTAPLNETVKQREAIANDPDTVRKNENENSEGSFIAKKAVDMQVPLEDAGSAGKSVQSGKKADYDVPNEGQKNLPNIKLSGERVGSVGDEDADLEPRELNPKPLFSPTTLAAIHDVISAYDADQGNGFRYVFTNGRVSLNFSVTFLDRMSPSAYDLIFHNCRKGPIDVSIAMVERNGNNYLSIGEQPLTILFLVFSLIYVFLSVVWSLHLRFSKAPVFRIHRLMLAMVIVKSISLMFHAINYFVIGRHGVQEEGWAAMDYIAHLTRGFLLIVTILMIGAGWTFIKHVFTRKEKQVFLIVIPLQVFANIATIVINETEQGAKRFALWNEIFTVVDLLCCAGVLFPVIWSIRHLRQAAQTDGKVAQNLRKLRLFRHFYILVICYIYFTRIIVNLLRMTTPFAWTWLVELFEQTVTLIFYISVGHKFRPFNDNPYLQLPTSEEQEAEDVVMELFNMEEALSQSGMMDGVTRIHRPQNLEAARENRRRREDAANRPLPGDAEAADSDLLPLIHP